MNNNHSLDDENEESGGWVKNISTIVMAAVAIAGIITSFFWTLSDFKVKDTEVFTKMSVIEKRMDELTKQFTDLDRHGSRGLIGLETTLRETKDEVRQLREMLERTRDDLMAHDEKFPTTRRSNR